MKRLLTLTPLSLGLLFSIASASDVVHAANSDAAVVFSEDAGTATLTNNIVSAVIQKTDGKILSLKYSGVELMSRGRLSICGARGGPVDVALNCKPVGSTGERPESGVMHRDGIRGTLVERDVKFDAALLKPGSNVIELIKHVRAWTDGVLYDYLRLELDSEKPLVP